MTKIKLCGLTQAQDIDAANLLKPDYVGFVFYKKSRRYVTPEKAAGLKAMLHSDIKAVGVFVNEMPEMIAEMLNAGIIDMAQLHGQESENYIATLRKLTDKPIMQAFPIACREDLKKAENSSADFLLMDSGAGTGMVFDWELLQDMKKPYFLAGGLTCGNVGRAVRTLHPYGVDVSSGIETDGRKDKHKMGAFTAAVRKEDEI